MRRRVPIGNMGYTHLAAGDPDGALGQPGPLQEASAMICRSPFPNVPVPAEPLTTYVLGDASRFGSKPALIDASTGATISYEALATEVKAIAAGFAERG